MSSYYGTTHNSFRFVEQGYGQNKQQPQGSQNKWFMKSKPQQDQKLLLVPGKDTTSQHKLLIHQQKECSQQREQMQRYGKQTIRSQRISQSSDSSTSVRQPSFHQSKRGLHPPRPFITSTASTEGNLYVKSRISRDLSGIGPGCGSSLSTGGAIRGKLSMHDSKIDSDEMIDAPPIGKEYIEELRVPDNQNHQRGGLNRFTSQFWCKLCDCRFTDPQAKEAHIKGRRHRQQYKKKVDPNLEIDSKPSARGRRLADEKGATVMAKSETVKQITDQRMQEMQVMEWSNHFSHRSIKFSGGVAVHGISRQRIDTNDDRHAIAKHSSIYPTEEELQLVQFIVTKCEKALKFISDELAEESDEPVLKGIMRVGVLAKGLLLHGDLATNLVLLCSDKPTQSLLQRIYKLMPQHLHCDSEQNNRTKHQLTARIDAEDPAIVVECEGYNAACTITLTSPILRDLEGADKADPVDMLDKEKCLDALASVRHAKWFQAKASSIPACLIVTRLLRDLCQRLTSWSALPEWAMELLVEKCIDSGGGKLSLSESLKRVFECLAAGIILPGGLGVSDPCEKEQTDVCASLTSQEREDITAAAQRALRLIAFRQLHKVLDMDRLPPFGTKRTASDSHSESNYPKLAKSEV